MPLESYQILPRKCPNFGQIFWPDFSLKGPNFGPIFWLESSLKGPNLSLISWLLNCLFKVTKFSQFWPNVLNLSLKGPNFGPILLTCPNLSLTSWLLNCLFKVTKFSQINVLILAQFCPIFWPESSLKRSLFGPYFLTLKMPLWNCQTFLKCTNFWPYILKNKRKNFCVKKRVTFLLWEKHVDVFFWGGIETLSSKSIASLNALFILPLEQKTPL